MIFLGILNELEKFPLLTHEEEEQLANKWIKSNCFEAAHKLINAHLRLVVKISMKFRGYGLPLNELISEGNIGLIQSLNRFDPKKALGSQHTPCGGLGRQFKNLYYTHGHW